MLSVLASYVLFFFNDTATTEIYTLSLHDALPISFNYSGWDHEGRMFATTELSRTKPAKTDRKSTRLNSSHRTISYAVFCLKKKKKEIHTKAQLRSTDMARRSSRKLAVWMLLLLSN